MMDHSHMKDLRLKVGMTQAKVAEELSIGLRTIRRYEKGETPIPNDRAEEFLALIDDIEATKIFLDKKAIS